MQRHRSTLNCSVFHSTSTIYFSFVSIMLMTKLCWLFCFLILATYFILWLESILYTCFSMDFFFLSWLSSVMRGRLRQSKNSALIEVYFIDLQENSDLGLAGEVNWVLSLWNFVEVSIWSNRPSLLSPNHKSLSLSAVIFPVVFRYLTNNYPSSCD